MGLLLNRPGANLIGGYFWSGEAVGQIGSGHAPDTQVIAPLILAKVKLDLRSKNNVYGIVFLKIMDNWLTICAPNHLPI